MSRPHIAPPAAPRRLIDMTDEDLRLLLREELARRPVDEYLSIEQAEQRFSISETTVRRILRDGRVPVLRHRSLVRFTLADFVAGWQSEGAKSPEIGSLLAKALLKSG